MISARPDGEAKTDGPVFYLCMQEVQGQPEQFNKTVAQKGACGRKADGLAVECPLACSSAELSVNAQKGHGGSFILLSVLLEVKVRVRCSG